MSRPAEAALSPAAAPPAAQFPAPLSPLSSAMVTLGDQWNLLILLHAFVGHTRRFSEWRDLLGASESVLADRLRELVAAGVLTTVEYRATNRRREEYLLTERGLELWSLLVAIWAWESQWVGGRGQLPKMRHLSCGQYALPVLGCGGCGAHPVTARDTETLDESHGRLTAGTRARHHRKSSRPPSLRAALAYHPETLDILGDRWSTMILGAAFLRVRTFAEFKSRLKIAPSVLTTRLRSFTEHGVFTIVEEPGRRGHDYRLTEKGLAFFSVFAFLGHWSDRWFAAADNPPDLVMTHVACGTPFRPILVCGACEHPLSRKDVAFEIEVAQRAL